MKPDFSPFVLQVTPQGFAARPATVAEIAKWRASVDYFGLRDGKVVRLTPVATKA